MKKIKEWIKYYKDEDFFPVGEGWKPLVMKLAKDIAKIDDEVIVAQCKEKYGGLRFYIYGGTDEVYDLIEKAEEESYEICEICGTKENVETKSDTKHGWILTLCSKCREEK